ncbi:hypothetical protein BKA82DRAFT_11187 [Pisolithus tinctorius]|uniref:Uncharacterized protein n=1 Tax=Pisolithus tinctorius Marx 270 TaxID=870435 RepID=A0A0C3NI47_PISTI|nr:hypothetical protein BKA82DRAFT_11187 [Pisolithus tinctorius]KIN95103.1 hypothetical protein M404DRAFT_11187 [Pisolithus tinctorius Marx 270]
MVMVDEETKEDVDMGKAAISLTQIKIIRVVLPSLREDQEIKTGIVARAREKPKPMSLIFLVREIPETYPGNDFDITAIEYNCPVSPEYSPAPAAVKTVYSSDMEATLGSYTIVPQCEENPKLSQEDITMAMEHVGYVPQFPIQPDGTLANWYQEEIQYSFSSEVEVSRFQNGFIPSEIPATGDNRSSFKEDSVSLC